MTTSEYFSQWVEEQKTELQRSTYESITIYFHRHIIPWFRANANDLSQLTAKNVRDYIHYIKIGGRLDGKAGGLGQASVKKHLSMIRQALDSAVIDGYIIANPAKSVRLKRTTQPYSDKTVMLTAEEANRLLTTFRGHRLYALVMITLYYGLRRSEVLGLKWSAVDFEHNELRIDHTIVKNLTIEEKDCTKTAGSRAVFDLLPQVRDILLSMKQNQNGDDYIFVDQNGKVLRPDTVTRAFQKHLKKCGFPKMRFHDLRHSTASVLFDSGMSLEEVKMWLRHTDIETTSNIYLHYGRGRKKITSDKVAAIFQNAAVKSAT